MWKDIPNFEGQYQVSDNGLVRSVERHITDSKNHFYTIKSRILRPNKTKNGYLIVHLCKNGKRHALYIHKLVAEAFIPNPNNHPIVNHKNGDKTRCDISNLEWSTYSENNQHAYDTGLKPRGEGQYKAKLTENDVVQIRKQGKTGTFESIAQQYGVSKATIRDVLSHKTWKHVT